MSKEKAKHMPKRTPSRLSWRKVIAILIALIVSILATLILLPPTYPPTVSQTFLPDDLRPLAEEIFLTVGSSEPLNANGMSFRLDTSLYATDNWMCIGGMIPEHTQYEKYSRIWVNGKRVRGVAFYGYLVGFSRDGWQQLDRCFHGELESGLHLIEFHLRDSMWGEPVAIQRWAIEIE